MSDHPPVPWNTPLSVTRLNELIREVLEEGFPYVQVRGEVANLRIPPSGHAYFTLTDGESSVRAVVWRNTLRRIPQPPREGEGVLATGRISLFPPRGEYQLIVEGLKGIGAGDEREQLRRLHARLAAEGVFDEGRKRPLPYLPAAVGVVTSAGGAAIHDILQVLERRFPPFHLILAHATVQGGEAPERIVQALELLAADGRAEVIICGRGGGSAEDLAAFNDERVVRAIAASPIPVVSAVGHEVDLTLADLAADLRAPTPSAAAELVMPERTAVGLLLERLASRLGEAMTGRLIQRRREVAHLRQRLRHPRQMLDQARLKGDHLTQRLQQSLLRLLERRRQSHALLARRLNAWPGGRYLTLQRTRLQQLESRLRRAMERRLTVERERVLLPRTRLESLSPLAILGRGYAIVRDREGGIVRQARRLALEEPITVTLAEGSLAARITHLNPE